MAEPFKIAATGDIPWVTVPSNDYVFPQDTWLQAIEVRPGNRAVVHHAVAAAAFPGDNPDGGGSNIHLYSPGLEAMIWRDGYGKLMPKGTRISFSDALQRDRQGDRPIRRRSGSIRDQAGAHAGEHDDHLEHERS